MCRLDSPSGPIALELLHFLIAARVWSALKAGESERLCLRHCLVIVLKVLEVLCLMTLENWLLNWLAMSVAEVRYFPLNFIAWFSLVGGWPFSSRRSLKSLPESVLLPISLILSLQIFFLLSRISNSISLFNTLSCGEVGSLVLRASLSIILAFASSGMVGRSLLMRP